MRNFLMAVVLFATVGGLSAHAQDGAKKKASPKAKKASLHEHATGQGYGAAGCGFGSVVFGAKPGMIQIVAATLNNLTSNQTYGITSGTLNCDLTEDGVQAAQFIDVNRSVIMKEAARGRGEMVNTLAGMLKCNSESMLASDLKSNYRNYFKGGNDGYEVVRRILSNGKCNEG